MERKNINVASQDAKLGITFVSAMLVICPSMVVSILFTSYLFLLMSPILTITGSDSTGLSGIQADVRTMASLGATAATALTCLTVQTTLGIQEFFDVPASIVEGQMEAIFNDVAPDVVKVGLIRSQAVLNAVVDSLQRHRPRHVVYDPVFLSSRGEALVPLSLRQMIVERLLPLCTYVVEQRQQGHTPMHGLSNAMASAVCVFLNQGQPLPLAIAHANDYVDTLVVRSMGLTSRSSMLYNDFLSQLSSHLYAHSDVAYYASRLNVSTRYLGQVCRRVAGKAPKTIIDEQLLRQTQVQLATTQQSMQQIAAALGYSSQAHLTKFFKKMTGTTPSQYRKERLP